MEKMLSRIPEVIFFIILTGIFFTIQEIILPKILQVFGKAPPFNFGMDCFHYTGMDYINKPEGILSRFLEAFFLEALKGLFQDILQNRRNGYLQSIQNFFF